MMDLEGTSKNPVFLSDIFRLNNLSDQDAAVALAKNVVDIKYTGLPQEAVSAARNDILDTLAVAVGGSSAPGVQEVFELVKYWGGREQSTILGNCSAYPDNTGWGG